MDIFSQKANYFKEKERVKYLILKTNKDNILGYNYMVLAVMFRVENNTFTEWLRTAIRDNKTTQAILKKMSQEDVKGFTKEDKFLIF